jgi:hypothetical protein
MAIVMKFIIMTSATGRYPPIAAPIAAPTIACSEIGVVFTRFSPNLVDRPLVAPITPPSSGSATSSPSTSTLGSASIASWSARLTASTIDIFFGSVMTASCNFVREYVALEFGNIGVLSGQGCGCRRVYLLQDRALNPRQLGLVDDAVNQQPRP